EEYARNDERQVDSHAPGELLGRELADPDQAAQELDRGDGDDGPHQLDLEVREADLAHPARTVFVFDGELRDEVLVSAQHDNEQKTRDEGDVDERQNGNHGGALALA